MTLVNFYKLCRKAYKDNPTWRLGQAYFNVLYEVHPELADEIRGGDVDPFYNDVKIGEFFNYLLRHGEWE